LTESSEIQLDAVIVVVAFNEAQRIGDCLRALLDQVTDQRFEVLVVDDGSSDDTSRVVEHLQALDPRLNLIRHDVNLGRGAARRTGQDAVVARHIAFVDADIIVPTDWLQRCSDALREFSAVSAMPIPDGDSAVVWRIFGATVRPRVGFSGITGNNVIFDADVLRQYPFDARYSLGEDFRLSHRLLRSGHKLRVLSDLSVEHRESKSYRKTIQYMWQTGVDATSHPFEFHIVRLADVSWALWLLGTLASLVAAGVGWWSWLAGIVSVLAITSLTTLIYTFSRFRLWPGPLNWLGSAAGSLPLLLAYLFGRTWGLTKLPSLRRRRASA
jgi:glycosyltransferase involved in cell wall biosynthesis